jgi:acetyltransferase-like isoleucine patch superfamily enzyme
MMENDDEEFGTALVKGHRLRKLFNQILTMLAFIGPGSGFRVLCNRLKGARIGEHCWIGDNVTIDIHYAHPDRANSLKISHHVAIGPGVRIFTHDTSSAQVSMGRKPVKFRKVSIGEHTWIGAGSVVANCSIGKHCIIAPNSLVTTDVPDYTLAMGVPADNRKDIKSRARGPE